ncbi:MAG: hypothetical protein AVDCRST_MAG67-3818, partial [uncultured Solirubrobacteraceae bacterium]
DNASRTSGRRASTVHRRPARAHSQGDARRPGQQHRHHGSLRRRRRRLPDDGRAPCGRAHERLLVPAGLGHVLRRRRAPYRAARDRLRGADPAPRDRGQPRAGGADLVRRGDRRVPGGGRGTPPRSGDGRAGGGGRAAAANRAADAGRAAQAPPAHHRRGPHRPRRGDRRAHVDRTQPPQPRGRDDRPGLAVRGDARAARRLRAGAPRRGAGRARVRLRRRRERPAAL